MYCFLSKDNESVCSIDQNIKSFDEMRPLIKVGSAQKNEHFIKENTPISNQGKLGSCVANATCDAFEILRGQEDSTKVEQLSRLFVYWNARLYSKDTDKDSGTYITNAMQSLTDYGVCSENLWSYDVNKVFTQPNQLCYKQGDDNRFSDYYKIRSTGQQRLDDIEAAILSNHPVVFATGVDQAFENYYSKGKVWNAPDTFNGYHALIVVGFRYNPNIEFYIRNSWGEDWGDYGHAWFSANYMTWSETQDIYVGTQMSKILQ